MTFRRHPALRGLGKAPPPTTVANPQAWAVSQAVMTNVKQVKSHPFLLGARFDQAAYDRARAQASSLVEAAADMAGTTTLEKADIQQLILGGLNVLGNAANMLGMMALQPGSEWRALEARLISSMDSLGQRLNAFVATANANQPGGLGFIMIAIIVGVIAYYLGTTDETIAVMRDICTQNPNSDACRQLIDQQGNMNPTKPIADAAGKLVWWVGIGVAVLIGGYVLFTIGPAAGRASSAVRQRSRGRGRGMRGGPRRVFDLDGPSRYNLEV